MAGSTKEDDVVIATAHQIVRNLAVDKSAADDMLRILSTFDNRFSSINFNQHSSTASGDAVSADTYGTTEECVIVEADDDEDVDETRIDIQSRVDRASEVIYSHNSGLHDVIFEYLQHIDDLIWIVNNIDMNSYSDLIQYAEYLIQLAMIRLEDEFRLIMIKNTLPLDASGMNRSFDILSLSYASVREPNASSVVDGVETLNDGHDNYEEVGQNNNGLIRIEAIDDLKYIADTMLHANYSKELCTVYSNVRREILDECLSVVGVERMSIDEIQKMDSKILDVKMGKWIHAVKVLVIFLLSGERVLCDQVFDGWDEIREECFVESTKRCVMSLLNFGDAVAIQKRSSEKLFRILDMYEALVEVKPKLDVLYAGDMGKNIIEDTKRIMECLADATRATLVEFGNRIQSDNSKNTTHGDLHPLPQYVMNYIRMLGDYSTSFEPLLENDVDCSVNCIDSVENISKLGRRIHVLVSYLESSLEEMSKSYEDAALRYIFLMNNMHYIVRKVKDSDLINMVGENWVRKHRGKVRQYHSSYLRATCTKILSSLRDDGLSGSGSRSPSNGSKLALKEKFKNFNLAFEELYKIQVTWKVPDPQLKEELRLSTSEQIVPAYRGFLGRYKGQLENSRHALKYIKYSPEDLDECLMKLFEGSALVSNHHRRKLSMS